VEDNMNKKILPAIALLFLFSGCTGMNQTHLSKDQYGHVTRTSKPIARKTAEPEFHAYTKIIVENENNVNVQPEVNSRSDAGINGNSTSFNVNDQSPTINQGFKAVGFDVNIITTGLIIPFTTNFHSSSLDNIKWEPEPYAYGTGYEANVYLFQDQHCDFAVGGGAFKSRFKTNSWEQNGIYVNETTKAESYWAHCSIKYKPNSWLYAQGLLGLFYYRLKTDILTNAPVYTYDGLSGNDLFGAWGIGGGIESPWKGRLHLFAGIRFWFPTCRYSDYGAVQANAGFSFKF
jgi:hypothetical protein